MPLEDVLLGPGHVARKLMQDIKADTSKDLELNDEQVLVIALLIWPLERAWRDHLKGRQGSCATVDTLRKNAKKTA